MNNKKLIIVGLIYIPLGIILGAMGAHYLETIGVPADKINSFEVGVRYLLYTGIAFLALAGIVDKFSFRIRTTFRLVMWGSILFSGSIFGLTLLPVFGIENVKILGPITPLGGVLMIVGWLILLVKFLRTYKA